MDLFRHSLAGLRIELGDADHSADLMDAPFGEGDEPRDLARIRKQLEALLAVLDADCPYQDWLNVLLAIHHETGGDHVGFEVADRWSKKGRKYQGVAEIEVKWKSFRSGSSNPVTIATLKKLVAEAGYDWMHLLDSVEDQFEVCETETVSAAPAPSAPAAKHSMAKFSLMGRSDELEATARTQTPFLGRIALLGQATVIYAAPNTGKTLLTLHLIIQGVNQGLFDPAKVFYVNMDDNSKGLLDKNRLAEEYGFHMIADGHRGFSSADLPRLMQDMVATDTVDGTMIVLDTLKKFTDVMNKGDASGFAKFVRRFVMKGGTLVALAHTNKKPDQNGRAVYSGTTDIVDDFDCAYTLSPVTTEAGVKVVQFENFKRRGNVPASAAYQYAAAAQVEYHHLLLSVKEVDDEDLQPIKEAAAMATDALLLEAVASQLRQGVNTKMKLIAAVRKATDASVAAVCGVIERYTGTDPKKHRWTFKRVARGAQHFELLSTT